MRLLIAILSAALLAAALPTPGSAQVALSDMEQLGKAIFFDQTLSFNANQACAACHAPASGWTGPVAGINGHGAVYEGSIPGRFGNRKPPSAAYATPSPILYLSKKGMFVGGNFWDGRATGERLGSPSAEQALGPFLNPLEQALGAPADVVGTICGSSYGDLFTQVCGAGACDPANVSAAYDCVGLSVAAYEDSAEVNAFSSKFDLSRRGRAFLTPQENRGFGLFQGKGKCAKCHVSNGQRPLFTDFTFDNLGVPKNPENPFYHADPTYNPAGEDWIDLGLGGFLASRVEYAQFAPANFGKHKVPTVRNVDKWDPVLGDKVKAFGHNGYFKSLEEIVHFYNTRDVLPVCPGDYTSAEAMAAGCWPAPEVSANVNTAELGNLRLTPAEEAAIVAFLKTLSDGYLP